MTASQKYLFENDFAQPEEMRQRAAIYSEQDMAAAKSEAFEAGRNDMLAEQRNFEEQRIAEILTRLGDCVQDLRDNRAADLDAISSQAGDMALAICRKVLPTLSAQNALTEIEGLIMRNIVEMQDEPRLVVRVSDTKVEDLQARFERIAGGFEGSLVLLGDDELAETDCALLWADGGAERNLDRLWAELETALAAINDSNTQPAAISPLDGLNDFEDQAEDLPDAFVSAAAQPQADVDTDTANQESGHG